MITTQQLERLAEIAAMEDAHLRGWRFFEFRDTLDVSEMRELPDHLEMYATLQKQREGLPAEIADRAQLEELAHATDWGFADSYPNMKMLLADIAHQCAFLRMCDFCNTDPDFLAKITESILAERATGVLRVVRRPHKPPISSQSCWDDRPRNRECLTLAIMTYYTQRPANSFSRMFFVGHKSSGSNSDGEFYFTWNQEE